MFAVAVTPARQAVMDFANHAYVQRCSMQWPAAAMSMSSPGWTLIALVEWWPWPAGTFTDTLMRERLHAAEAAGGGATSHSRGFEVESGRADVFHVGLSIYTPHGPRHD